MFSFVASVADDGIARNFQSTKFAQMESFNTDRSTFSPWRRFELDVMGARPSEFTVHFMVLFPPSIKRFLSLGNTFRQNTERLVLLSGEIILSVMDIFEMVIFGIIPKLIIPSDLKLTLGASPPNSRSFTLRGHGDFWKLKRRFFSHSIFPLLLNFDPGKLFRGTRIKTNRLWSTGWGGFPFTRLFPIFRRVFAPNSFGGNRPSARTTLNGLSRGSRYPNRTNPVLIITLSFPSNSFKGGSTFRKPPGGRSSRIMPNPALINLL